MSASYPVLRTGLVETAFQAEDFSSSRRCPAGQRKISVWESSVEETSASAKNFHLPFGTRRRDSCERLPQIPSTSLCHNRTSSNWI